MAQVQIQQKSENYFEVEGFPYNSHIFLLFSSVNLVYDPT
jgi:hypothetical protein